MIAYKCCASLKAHSNIFVRNINQIKNFYKLNYIKMVKQQYYQTNVDRYMTEYRMRTPYATPTQMNRSTPNQVSARSIRRHSAHERSHLRHNPTDPFYYSEGRIEKNIPKKKSYQQEKQIITNNHYHETVTTSPTKSSCCTIL